jgi:hypothetical protein
MVGENRMGRKNCMWWKYYGGMSVVWACIVVPSQAAEFSVDFKSNAPGVNSIKSNNPPVDSSESGNYASGLSSVIAKLGPVGYEVDPLTGGAKTATGEEKYRALYFTMSATPIFTPILRDGSGKTIGDVKSLSQDLKRFDTVIELIGLGDPVDLDAAAGVGAPVGLTETQIANKIKELEAMYFQVDLKRDAAGKAITPLSWAPARRMIHTANGGETVEVLAMLPNLTVAATEDNDLVKAAKLADPLANILIGAASTGVGGLLPASTFGPKLKNTSGGLATIFDGLVPPKSVPTQYAFQNSPRIFGWYFRQNTRRPETASILGTHNGAVILRLHKDVKAIGIRTRTLTIWRKAVLNGSPFDSTSSKQVLAWNPAADPKKSDDQWILDKLGLQAVMVPRAIAKEILSGTLGGTISEDELNLLIHSPNAPADKKVLVAAPNGAITKDSFLIFLGLKPAPPEGKGEGSGVGGGGQNKTMLLFRDPGQGTSLTP